MEISRPIYPTADEAHILCNMGEEAWWEIGQKDLSLSSKTATQNASTIKTIAVIFILPHAFQLMIALQAKNLFFSYGAHTILDGICLSLKAGEIAALVGPSGIGKTTLLKVLSSLIIPQQGLVERQGSVTYMDPDDLLLPWRTVLENTLLPNEFRSAKRSERERDEERAKQFLSRFGLARWLHAYPDALSSGMKKITSLVRALVSGCDILLLDEPFSSIDLSIRERLFILIQECAEREKKTILFVTHDFRDAVNLADRICILAKGKIVEEIPVALSAKASIQLQGEILEKIRCAHALFHPLLMS